MATENKLLMQSARKALENKWSLAIGTCFVYLLISFALSAVPKIGGVVYLILGGAFAFGMAKFSLAISRNQEAELKDIFEGFQNFTTNLTTYLWMFLYICLWTLLLIVPSIIKGISYSMTFFILNDQPDLEPKEALKRSENLMDGYKMKYFRLSLRFLGWGLLCVLTAGIGFLWLVLMWV